MSNCGHTTKTKKFSFHTLIQNGKRFNTINSYGKLSTEKQQLSTESELLALYSLSIHLCIYLFIYSFHSFNFLIFRCCFCVFLFYHQITFRNILSLQTFLSKCHTICVMRDCRQFLTKKQEEKKNEQESLLFYCCNLYMYIYSIFI